MFVNTQKKYVLKNTYLHDYFYENKLMCNNAFTHIFYT